MLPLAGAAVAVSIARPAQTERASAGPDGAVIFRQRCAVCHSTGSLGAQGPGLGGVVGRTAGTSPFGYTRALRSSGLVWDAATLDRFLASPSAAVPGTTMPMPVPDPEERGAVIAYLATLHPDPAAAAFEAAPEPGDFRTDTPGERHHISLAELPPPYATPSARNAPTVVDPPPGALPRVPDGFSVAPFVRDLEEPRLLRVAPDGDVFVAESAAGRIRVLRARDGAGAPERNEVFARGLQRPFGIAFFPPGPDPSWVYVAETNAVVRFPYRNGDLVARGAPETIVPRLTEDEGGHWTRDIAFALDQKTMLVSVGSASNVAEDMPVRSQEENAAWDAAHGIGAAWGEETDRADVLAFDPDGSRRRVFAAGIRNCVGLAVHPVTGDAWCSTNERDGLGDDLVPDYVTRVRAGGFYGWPWYYLGQNEDPRHAGERRDLAGRITVPDVLIQAHSAPLQLAFYTASAFPPDWRGDAFVAMHGSWNRASRTGPKVVRVVVREGVPTADYVDFMTGFAIDDLRVWGRPVGVAVAHDGALLVSEDANGTIWRATFAARR